MKIKHYYLKTLNIEKSMDLDTPIINLSMDYFYEDKDELFFDDISSEFKKISYNIVDIDKFNKYIYNAFYRSISNSFDLYYNKTINKICFKYVSDLNNIIEIIFAKPEDIEGIVINARI